MRGELAFFGAFNPPTRAHVELAEIAMKATGREKVWFVPSKSVYIRDFQQKSFSYSDSERLEMLRRIAANRPWMRVTDWELEQPAQPRTYETLCELRRQGESPSLLVGADKLIELENKWLYVREIAAEFGIVCMDRGETDCSAVIQGSSFLRSLNITVVQVPDIYHGISSSQARERILQIRQLREELREMLPQELDDLDYQAL